MARDDAEARKLRPRAPYWLPPGVVRRSRRFPQKRLQGEAHRTSGFWEEAGGHLQWRRRRAQDGERFLFSPIRPTFDPEVSTVLC